MLNHHSHNSKRLSKLLFHKLHLAQKEERQKKEEDKRKKENEMKKQEEEKKKNEAVQSECPL